MLRRSNDTEWNRLLFTGPNGNTLFLPAAGSYDGITLEYSGIDGYYWSSELYDDYPYGARSIDFNADVIGWYYGDRYYGTSVRAVKNRKENKV